MGKLGSNQPFIMPGFTFGAASFALAALQAVPASAFWRMGCPGRLTLERIDPLFAPGSVSGHVHTVSGGSGFGFDTDYEQLRSSACSSCPIKQDLSAYWTLTTSLLSPRVSACSLATQGSEARPTNTRPSERTAKRKWKVGSKLSWEAADRQCN